MSYCNLIMRNNLNILVLIMLFISVMGYSQYKVSGEIVDYNNLPLEYAKVIIQTFV